MRAWSLVQPGSKELLLKKLLPKETGVVGDTGRKVDLTVKRKELSASDRRRLEAERQRAILLYRKAKAEAALKRT